MGVLQKVICIRNWVEARLHPARSLTAPRIAFQASAIFSISLLQRIVPCADGVLPYALGRNKALFRRFDRVGNTKFLVRLGNLRLGLGKRHGIGHVERLSFAHPATRSR